MTKITLSAIALLLMCNHAFASNWTEILKTDNYHISYDTSDLVKTKDGGIETRLKWVYASPQSDGDVSYRMSVERIRIECPGNRLKILDVSYYSDENTKVATKSIDKVLGSGQVAGKIVNFICKASSSIQPRGEKSMGTGFVVNKSGYVISCNHVIEGKTKVYCLVGQQEVKLDVIKTDSKNDIALLKMSTPMQQSVSFRKGKPAKPGENCTILGYPLQGLLAQEVNVTTGTISASAGPGNDIRLLQTTASVHPGNSGGPMFDTSGNVVGSVPFKMNALKLAQYIGDVPQNIGFALNGIIIKLFLDSNDIEYEEQSSEDRLEASQIVEKVKQSVVLVVAE